MLGIRINGSPSSVIFAKQSTLVVVPYRVAAFLLPPVPWRGAIACCGYTLHQSSNLFILLQSRSQANEFDEKKVEAEPRGQQVAVCVRV